MALIASFNCWNTKALIRNLGAYDYEFFAHWHLDAILKKIVSRAVRLLFPDWQPSISDDEVKGLKVDLASIGGNASASGSWLPATSDLGGGAVAPTAPTARTRTTIWTTTTTKKKT